MRVNGRLTLRESAVSVLTIGGWVGTRTGQDLLDKINNIFFPARNGTKIPGMPSPYPCHYSH
jgi:hypothetical protein